MVTLASPVGHGNLGDSHHPSAAYGASSWAPEGNGPASRASATWQLGSNDGPIVDVAAIADGGVAGGEISPALSQLLTDLTVRVVQLERRSSGPSPGGPCGTGSWTPNWGDPALSSGERLELDALRAGAERREQDVAQLRAQVARRLDSSAKEVATSRRDADEARAEVAALRAEVAELTTHIVPVAGEAGALCTQASAPGVPL